MDFEYDNGHRVLERGSSDGSKVIELCPDAINTFREQKANLAKDFYLGTKSVDELVSQANNILGDVNEKDTWEALSLAIAFDRFRILGEVGDKYLREIGSELRDRYSGLEGSYILNNVSGSFDSA